MTPEPGRAGCRAPSGGRVDHGALRAGAGVLASGAVAGEQWGWLGVRIRDLTEQEMEEIAKKVRRPRGLRRADRPGHEGDARLNPRVCARVTSSSPSTGGPSWRREPSSASSAPRRRVASSALDRAPRAATARRSGSASGGCRPRPSPTGSRSSSDSTSGTRPRSARPGLRRPGPGGGRRGRAELRRRSGGLRAGDRILAVERRGGRDGRGVPRASPGTLPARRRPASRRARGRVPRCSPCRPRSRRAGDEAPAHPGGGGRRHTSRPSRGSAPRVGVPGDGRAVRRARHRAARDAALRGRGRGHPLAGDGRSGDPPAPQAARSIDRGAHDDGRSHRGDRGGDAEAGRVRLPHEAPGARGAPPPAGPHPGAAPAPPGGQRAAEPPGRAAAHERAGRASRRRWKR